MLTALKSARLAIVVAIISICSAEDRRFTWGVVGHPLDGGVYKDFETAFSIAEKRGLSTFRFDLVLTSDHPNSVRDLSILSLAARKHQIELHPIVHVPFSWGDQTDGGRYANTNEGLEAQGYNRLYPVVKQFSDQIFDWELDNEVTLLNGFKSDAGDDVGDYQTTLAARWAALMRGESRAVSDVRRESGKPLRSVVNIVAVDFGFIPYLEAKGVRIDKVAYHYYYGVKTTPYQIFVPRRGGDKGVRSVDLFKGLAGLHKPTLINEFNAAEVYDPKNNKVPYDDRKAQASIKSHLDYILNQKDALIEGLEFYELYDEPERDAVESNFGLMIDSTHPKTQMLIAAWYSCGTLSVTERSTLLSKGLFSTQEIEARRVRCKVNASGSSRVPVQAP